MQGLVNIPDRLAALAREAPGAIAMTTDHGDLTWSALAKRIDSATIRLSGEWGAGEGHRIAFLGFNHPDQIILLAALMRLGAILVPLNYRLTPGELRAIVAHASITQVVADAEHAALAGDLDITVRDRDALAFPSTAEGAASALKVHDGNRPALLVYTSGTTGEPKGAVHTHHGLYWNAAASIAFHEFTAADTVLSALPMFHVGGLCIQTLPALCAGVRVILHARFDAGAWLDAVERSHPTISLMVPATMRAVQDHPRWASADLSSLRLLGAGSSTIPDGLIHAFHSRGVPVCQIYGATETGPVSIVLKPDDAFNHVGSAGKPAPGCAIRLVDECGDIEGADRIGEIRVRGPNVMQGYWREPDHPAFRDGWFHTGDLARRDPDGFYYVAGRSSDLIISGGEHIYPAEVENVLTAMPEISEATVIGVADPHWGEVPVAVIVLRAGALLSEDEIRSRFEGRLARFKRPRRVVFRATLPRNAMGKVLKSALLEGLQPPVD